MYVYTYTHTQFLPLLLCNYGILIIYSREAPTYTTAEFCLLLCLPPIQAVQNNFAKIWRWFESESVLCLARLPAPLAKAQRLQQLPQQGPGSFWKAIIHFACEKRGCNHTLRKDDYTLSLWDWPVYRVLQMGLTSYEGEPHFFLWILLLARERGPASPWGSWCPGKSLQCRNNPSPQTLCSRSSGILWSRWSLDSIRSDSLIFPTFPNSVKGSRIRDLFHLQELLVGSYINPHKSFDQEWKDGAEIPGVLWTLSSIANKWQT